MGYPPQPQGPYGQQPYGYGNQPPTGPPPPRSNMGLILLLAIGIPLLLLGSCAAVVLIVTDTRQKTVVTEAEADAPIVMPSRLPEATAPPSEDAERAVQDQPSSQGQPSTAAVGSALTLEGMNPSLKMTVMVSRFVDPAMPAQDFMKPKAGNKFVAVQLTLTNAGQAVYSDSPSNGAQLIDGEGQQYRSTLYDVREGPSFGGTATINTGDSRKGMIVFEVPESTRVAKFQFALNSGFADQKGEWALS